MRIFISGIGGTGMAPLAEMAFDAGIKIIGSDQKHSPQTAELEKRGARIVYKQTRDSIADIFAQDPFDWFIHSSAIPDDSEELKFVREQRVRGSKRDDFLAQFIDDHHLKLVAIAGTHGKTTTTSMLVWAFRELGIPASWSVGSTLSFANAGHYDGASEYFLYEADEYDRNFLAFYPYVSGVSALDYDHPDIYPTQESYDEAFRQFTRQSQRTILWKSASDQLFGVDDRGDPNVVSGIEVLYPAMVDINHITLPGQKIREDATLALTILSQITDVNLDILTEVINRYPGADRRFEKLRENLYSDYGHTPAEIKATLQKARELAGERKVVVVYQPHQNLRQREIVEKGGYGETFADADAVFWLPTYLIRGDLVDGAPKILSPHDLFNGLTERDKFQPAEMDDALWSQISRAFADGAIVIAIGAGPIDAWLRENVAKI